MTWYKCLHELRTRVSLYGCPVLMLFSYIWYWPVSRSEKRMHWVLGWRRMAPINVHIPHAPEGRNHYFMISLYSTMQVSLLPSFLQKVSNHEPWTHLAYWIICESSVSTNHVIPDLQKKTWFPAQTEQTKRWIWREKPEFWDWTYQTQVRTYSPAQHWGQCENVGTAAGSWPRSADADR